MEVYLQGTFPKPRAFAAEPAKRSKQRRTAAAAAVAYLIQMSAAYL